MSSRRSQSILFFALCLALSVQYASAQEHEDSKKTMAVTPAGTMVQVDELNEKGLGMPVYPGARPVSRTEDDMGVSVMVTRPDSKGEVLTARYSTPDPKDKVVAYYKSELAQFGNVLECRGHQVVSYDVRDPKHKDELTCEDGNVAAPAQVVVLKAGSHSDQHMVVVKRRANATEFRLIYASKRSTL